MFVDLTIYKEYDSIQITYDHTLNKELHIKSVGNSRNIKSKDKYMSSER